MILKKITNFQLNILTIFLSYSFPSTIYNWKIIKVDFFDQCRYQSSQLKWSYILQNVWFHRSILQSHALKFDKVVHCSIFFGLINWISDHYLTLVFPANDYIWEYFQPSSKLDFPPWPSVSHLFILCEQA